MDIVLTQFHKVQMEAILGPELEPFETFISNHMESSEETVSEAKSMFNMMKHKDPNSFALKLALGSSYDIYSREKCTVLLKQLLTDEDDLCTWSNLSVSTQSTIKSILLSRIKSEESRFIIQELRDTVSKLAASLLPDNNWPELLPFLYQCLTSTSNNYLKRSAFILFRQLAKDIGETIVPCVKDMHSLFLNTLNDDTLDVDVRIEAMSAVFNFIKCVLSSNEKELFQDLLPGMMGTLTNALSNNEEKVAAHEPLKVFIKLAKNEPRFFRRQLVDVVDIMFEIAESESLDQRARHFAVLFFITLIEAKEKAAGMLKRLPLFISRYFAMLLKLLLDSKDDPAWNSGENVHDYAGILICDHKIGEEGLHQFSLALQGEFTTHIAIEQLCAYLAAPEWEKRHAALIALAQIAEGFSEVMIKNLEQMMNMVLNCFQDPHPRVRWAACWAISQLLIDFSPLVQEQYHNQIFLALAAAMDDFQNPRVQAFATAALCNFCVPDEPETLIPYLDGIVNKLLVLLQHNKQMVQEQALTAFSSIAQSVKEHFRTNYDTVMPHLRTVLRNAHLNSNLILRARAMECISVVGMAVGMEKFKDDVEQVMEVLMSLQGLQAKACTRICKCMGRDFLPYMSAIMPFLIKCAELEPVMTISAKLDYEYYELNDNSIEKIKLGDKTTFKKGDVPEEKVVACDMLCWYSDILQEDFYPWISQVVSIFVPLLKCYIHNPLRRSAVVAMPILLRSAKLAFEKGIAQGESESYFAKLSDYIILSLVEAMHKEHVTEICAIMLGELNYCLQICRPLPTEGQVRSIVNEIKHAITESSSRKQALTERNRPEDVDAEEAELLRGEREQEEEVFENVGEILITLIKAFKAAFLPFLEELSPYLLPMWAKETTTNERCTSICIFDALVEVCPEAALKYYDVCLPLIFDASNDENPAVRQAAFYGLGLWAEYGRSSFKPFVAEALSRIKVVIMHMNALEPENEKAYDNVVFALSKICQFHGESIDLAQVIPVWLNCLPIKADLDEAKDVHEQLCSMVERSDREVLGPNYEYLPKVVSIFAEVLCAGEDLATEGNTKRMINLLRHFQETIPPATLAFAWSLLLPQHEMELESILSVPKEDVNILTHAMKLVVLCCGNQTF
ncbi:PREDICTED: importin-5-like isoform X2 [Nicotiana attenuata]|uniref:importin-5-like isoform X2 n=1 Tax=Nicotiana attenuata TaxID=49451 RepID=UPI0009046446|nr:PREDICTED: importin-5-like isoform X2 [Nicotiana attenuata]